MRCSRWYSVFGWMCRRSAVAVCWRPLARYSSSVAPGRCRASRRGPGACRRCAARTRPPGPDRPARAGTGRRRAPQASPTTPRRPRASSALRQRAACSNAPGSAAAPTTAVLTPAVASDDSGARSTPSRTSSTVRAPRSTTSPPERRASSPQAERRPRVERLEQGDDVGQRAGRSASPTRVARGRPGRRPRRGRRAARRGSGPPPRRAPAPAPATARCRARRAPAGGSPRPRAPPPRAPRGSRGSPPRRPPGRARASYPDDVEDDRARVGRREVPGRRRSGEVGADERRVLRVEQLDLHVQHVGQRADHGGRSAAADGGVGQPLVQLDGACDARRAGAQLPASLGARRRAAGRSRWRRPRDRPGRRAG